MERSSLYLCLRMVALCHPAKKEVQLEELPPSHQRYVRMFERKYRDYFGRDA